MARAAFLLMGACLLSAQAPADTLTRRQAEAMTLSQLAVRVLGMAGATMREARLNEGQGLSAIEFTAGGRGAGWGGLCTAYVTTVTFHPAVRGKQATDVASVARGPEVHPLWSVLTDPAADDPADSQARYVADEAMCLARPRVLAENGDWFRATWRDQRDLLSGEASFAATLLRRLDRPDSTHTVRCEKGVEGCPDALGALARIDMLRPARVDLTPCGSKVCATIEVERRGLTSIAGDYTQVKVETDAAASSSDDYRILSVVRTRRHWVV